MIKAYSWARASQKAFASGRVVGIPQKNNVAYDEKYIFGASFCRPFGAYMLLHIYPRLTPWAAFLRRFAAVSVLQSLGHCLAPSVFGRDGARASSGCSFHAILCQYAQQKRPTKNGPSISNIHTFISETVGSAVSSGKGSRFRMP